MRITALTMQQRDPNRVNVMVDGKFRFSLDVTQVIDSHVKVGKEFTAAELAQLETESQFGKLYARALEYCLMRPHSSREVRDYLYRKTIVKRYKSKRTGEMLERPGYGTDVTERVFERLVEKGYINDEKFAEFWIENRNLRKGTSQRKLQAELAAKGVDRGVVERLLSESERNDVDELSKIIAKKRSKYDDDTKFMQYLARLGFRYDDIKNALQVVEE